jgi:hypothetical protein
MTARYFKNMAGAVWETGQGKVFFRLDHRENGKLKLKGTYYLHENGDFGQFARTLKYLETRQ